MPTRERCSPISISDLPEEILVNIITRAPVKSVVLCKSVSKTWFDLLSDPSFAKLQFQRSLSKKTTVISSSITHSEEVYQFDREEDVCLEQFHHPFNDYFAYASCNGLLLLLGQKTSVSSNFIVKVLLCNPILKDLVELPPVNYDEYNRFGIGFSNVSNKYKVVHFSRNQARVCLVGGHEMSWRQVECTSLYKDEDFIGPVGAYAHGALHWWRRSSTTYSIVCFDIETEQFGLFSLPWFDDNEVEPDVGELGGCLAIVHLRDTKCSVWVMKQYGVHESWNKEINVEIRRSWTILTPMLKLKNGDILFSDYKCVLTYDSKRKVMKQEREFSSIPIFLPYVPSLLSPKHL